MKSSTSYTHNESEYLLRHQEGSLERELIEKGSIKFDVNRILPELCLSCE